MAGMRLLLPSLAAMVCALASCAVLVSDDALVSVGQVGTTMPPAVIYVADSLGDGPDTPLPPWLTRPLLFFVNDTAEQITVRGLDDPSLPIVVMEPQARFATVWGGQFFGGPSVPEDRREALRQGPGIPLEVVDQAGQRQGHIHLAPAYLFGPFASWLCLSQAAEPPWLVDSPAIHLTHRCP